MRKFVFVACLRYGLLAALTTAVVAAQALPAHAAGLTVRQGDNDTSGNFSTFLLRLLP